MKTYEPSYHIHDLYGDQPPFNVWTSWVVNDTTQETYMYGGCRPGDQDNQPTNDFYVLKVKDDLLTWKCLNTTLRYRGEDRFSPGKVGARRAFPALRQPAMTLATINENAYIFIFGGFSSEHERVVSDLIAVDVLLEEWWFVTIEGGPVMARLDAAMTAIGTSLYIFGGRRDFIRDSTIGSYSVAWYSTKRRSWRWFLKDRPYPSHVPQLGFDMTLIPVHHRRWIVLIPGRKRRDEDAIHITRENVFLFDVDDLSFDTLDIPAHKFSGQVKGVDAAPLHPQTRSKSAPFKFIVAGWVPFKERSLIPELWVCKPYPSNQYFRCVGVKERLWEENVDLQDCVVCDGRIFLLGYKQMGGLDYVHAPANSTWNVAIEVGLKKRKVIKQEI